MSEPVVPVDPAGALAEWSAERLVVPPGHPLAGEPMMLPDYGVEFIRDALAHRESLLCMGRKNSKSGIVAVLSLGLLVGPLARPGLRIGTVSVTREKAGELLRQMTEIARASQLKGLQFLKTPVPGWVRTPDGASAEFLSADKSAGHASGFDVVIVDELGLMTERDRELIAGMRSATSARDGRFVAISIRGESPMLEEMIARRDLAAAAVHLYAPDVDDDDDVDIHDPAVWAAGNPGLACGIKSKSYMADEAARVTATPSDRATFVAFDLNLPQSPTREMIFS
ncbi:MAG: terminase large subunit, partial [Acidimicrobiaceae bacterium]|nr:terminase large subunit [Acidimicrobiaceae bacterium]